MMETTTMRSSMKLYGRAVAAGLLTSMLALASAQSHAEKLGFLVKQPEEPWFQTEWKFADKAGQKDGFDVLKIAVPDGEKTLAAIDSLAANGARDSSSVRRIRDLARPSSRRRKRRD